jgi:hypothetical protein
MHQLLKRDAKYVWEENQDAAFHALKQKIISQPILQYPDFLRKFIQVGHKDLQHFEGALYGL